MQSSSVKVVSIAFGENGNSDRSVGKGWSAAESGFRWMIDDFSEFWIDANSAVDYSLSMDLHPHVGLPLRPAQRMVVKVSGVEVYRVELSQRTVCEINIPILLTPDGSSVDRLHVVVEHPDAISPMDLTGQDDHRQLAFAIREATLYQGSSRNNDSIEISAPAIIAEPKKLSTVFVGNCQMGALCTLYKRLVPSDGDHDVTYVASYQDATDDDRHVIAQATTVVQQVLNFVPRIGEIATHAKVYLVPHASAAFLWPYGGSPHPLNRPEAIIEQSGPYNAELGDSFLNRLIASETEPSVAMSKYLSAGASTVGRAERMMELHLQKQRERDKACDISIADRIERIIQKEQLFRSPNHPESVMASWIASEVFARMGESESAIAQLVASKVDVLPATETPIHPAIAQHFGLKYAYPGRRYRYFEEGGFTFEEYVLRYMQYEWDARLAESLSLFRRQPSNSTIAAVEEALLNAPRSAIARMSLVDTLIRLGRIEDAIEYACQAVTLEPDNRVYLRQLTRLANSVKTSTNTSRLLKKV